MSSHSICESKIRISGVNHRNVVSSGVDKYYVVIMIYLYIARTVWIQIYNTTNKTSNFCHDLRFKNWKYETWRKYYSQVIQFSYSIMPAMELMIRKNKICPEIVLVICRCIRPLNQFVPYLERTWVIKEKCTEISIGIFWMHRHFPELGLKISILINHLKTACINEEKIRIFMM